MNNRQFNNSPEYLNLLLESSNEGVIAFDNFLNVTFRNRRMSEIHGYPQDVSPHLWTEYIQLFDADGVTRTPRESMPVLRALKGERVKNQYHVLKRKGLGDIHVKYSAQPLFENNLQIGMILTAEDCNDMAYSIVRFQAIFDQSPLSIQIVEKSGKTILVNSAFSKLWNFTQSEISEYVLGKYNILDDKVLEVSGRLDLIRKAFQGEPVVIPEFLYDPATQNLPGRPRWTSGIVFPLMNSKNEVQEIVIIHQDVTEQRRANEDLEMVVSQMEGILRQLPAGLMVTDLKGTISLYNDQMRIQIGEPEKALDLFRPIIDRSLKGDICKSEEVKVTHVNGSTNFLSTSSGPIQDADGNITSSIIISTDITQEKRIEKNEAFLTGVKSILSSIIDYDLILDKISAATIPYLADGCVIDIVENGRINRVVVRHWNPEIRSIMEEIQVKFPPELQSAQPSSQAIATGRPQLHRKVNENILKDNTISEEHLNLIRKLGMKSHIVAPLIIRGKVIGAINLILTEARPLYDEKDFDLALELARTASVAIDNAKLFKDAQSAIMLRDDFISIASHELRTPITSLNLQIEVLKNLIEDLNGDSETVKQIHRFFGNTKNQLKRLTRLVDDMLDISRINSGKLTLNLQNVNLTSLIHNVIERFQDQLRVYSIRCEFFYHSDVFIICDSEKIDQVVTNFMTNAIRYGQRSPIHIYLEETVENVVIQVKDHGRGISVIDQERIFKRFERAHTDEDVSGLGLGLFINTQIVNEHQGRIKLVSELGSGSNFIVELPKTRAYSSSYPEK